jgi:hypothetical protein
MKRCSREKQRHSAGNMQAGIIRAALLALLIFILLPPIGGAQVRPGSDEAKIDAAWKAAVVDSVINALDHNYVFPDVAAEMGKYLRQQEKKKAYKDITDGFDFAVKLTDDLREISHDKHLGVGYAPNLPEEAWRPDSLLSDDEKQKRKEDNLRDMKFSNFGFKKLEMMDGNVGYLDLRSFRPAEYGGPTAVAAMNFLANTEAVIIDLRENGGGSPSMIQLISSYFFDEPTHLNNFYYRPADSIQQFWTQAYITGPRMSATPLYVLTSSYTFSAAEEFTYNMKNLKRATIIGETTGGGAHPVDDFGFPNLKVRMRIPIGRAVNPITGTNWEGTGIDPDIAVPRDEALTTAYLAALKKIYESLPDEPIKERYQWLLETNEALARPFEIDPALMHKYAGVYGPRTVTFENGKLYYQREDRPKYEMIPMSNDTFIFDDIRYFRLKFVTDKAGNVIEVDGLYDDGHTDRSPRNPGQ